MQKSVLGAWWLRKFMGGHSFFSKTTAPSPNHTVFHMHYTVLPLHWLMPLANGAGLQFSRFNNTAMLTAKTANLTILRRLLTYVAALMPLDAQWHAFMRVAMMELLQADGIYQPTPGSVLLSNCGLSWCLDS